MEENKFSGWGLVEIMGHQRIAGRLGERCIAGANLLQVDVPTGQGENDFRTEFVGGHSIYRLHPTDERTARAIAKSIGTKPHYSYEVESQLRLEAPRTSEPVVAVYAGDDPDADHDEDDRDDDDVDQDDDIRF